MLGLEGEVAVEALAGCPTEEEVTCKMEAAEFENIAPQSVVGDSSGLVGLKFIMMFKMCRYLIDSLCIYLLLVISNSTYMRLYFTY